MKQLLLQLVTTKDQQNWEAKLLGYLFDIVYKLGLENKWEDALSLMHDKMEMNALLHCPEWLGSKEV